MKQILLVLITGFSSLFSFAQQVDTIINAAEVERIEKILSADDMQGRKTLNVHWFLSPLLPKRSEASVAAILANR